MKRRFLIALVTAAVVIGAIGTLFALTTITSPQSDTKQSTKPNLSPPITGHLSIQQLNQKAGQSNPRVVETMGVLVKKITIPLTSTSTMYAFVLEDDTGSKVLVDVNDALNIGSPSLYNTLQTGEYVDAIGGFGSLSCDASSRAKFPYIATLCEALNAKSGLSPAIIVNSSLMKYYGNRPSVKEVPAPSAVSKTIVRTTTSSNTPKLMSAISQAIQNYSDTTATNVNVLGFVTSLQPAQTDLVMAPFGNTVIIADQTGYYSAAVHNVSNNDFQNLAIGDEVEVTGGYMKTPGKSSSGGLVAQINDLGGSAPISVTKISSAIPLPSTH